jgi:hypothetical protein
MDATCPRCGAAFDCGADQPRTDPCWCAGVPLDPGTRDGLAAAFAGCLCPSCLTSAVTATSTATAATAADTEVTLRPRPHEERR